MERQDIPYVILTLFFGLVIFLAGRWSAPTPAPTVIRETVQAAPSVIIVPTAPAPVAQIPATALEPVVSAPTPAQVLVRTPKSAAMPSQPVVVTKPTPVPSIPVILEETPEDVANPYKTP